MPSIISLAGLMSNVEPNEPRALAYLDVVYNGNTYKWQSYVPIDTTNLDNFLESIKPRVEMEIDAKEAEWAALDPKTRTYTDPMTRREVTVDILKEEIVKPDIPDYYARRRREYPDLRDQVGAVWKGPGSEDYVGISQQIEEVKARHPKLYRSPQEQAQDLAESIVNATQRRLDTFARSRNYDGILSACTYVNSPVQKFSVEGQYCVQARALTWATLYQVLAEIEAGTRPAPSSFSDIEPFLPPLVWPN